MTGHTPFGLPPLVADLALVTIILGGLLGFVYLYVRQRRLDRAAGEPFSDSEKGDAAMRAMDRVEDGEIEGDDFVDFDGTDVGDLGDDGFDFDDVDF